MPTKDKITYDMQLTSKCMLKMLYDELYWCRIDSVLALFIIQLYELALVIYSPIGSLASYNNLANVYPENTIKHLVRIRNALAHNLYGVTDIRTAIKLRVESMTQSVFVDLCDKCGLQGESVWKLIISMCEQENVNEHIKSIPTLRKLQIMSEITGEKI